MDTIDPKTDPTDKSDDDKLAVLVRAEIAKHLAAMDYDATLERHRQATLAAERKIAELEFDKLVRENALLGHVIPSACKYFVKDARELFEIRDGILHPKNGQTQPDDPCAPLTFNTWLQAQRNEVPYLFAKEES